MLADALGLIRKQVIAEAVHRAGTAGEPARLDASLDELIEMLARGADSEQAPLCLAHDPEAGRRERELLRDCVLDKIAVRELEASIPETAIVSMWPYSVECGQGREERRRLLALLDNVDDITAVLATDGRILYLNDRGFSALQEATRVPRDQLLGRTLDELSIPEEFGLVRARNAVVSRGRARGRSESLIEGRAKETVFDTVYAADGTVIAIAVVVRDLHAQKLAESRLNILSKLGGLIGTLDYDQVAEALAAVPIPELADWCSVNIIEDTKIQRTFISQHNPAKLHLREALTRSFQTSGRHPLWQQLLTGGFQLLSDVNDDLVRRLSVDQEQYRLLSQIGIRSLMVMPVALGGQLAGIITFVYTDESGRRYGRDDPAIAEELALHAAHIIENARLLDELKAREKRFRIALAGARTAVFEQDRSLRYRYYYDPSTSTTPLDKTEADLRPPDQAARLAQIKRHVLETGESALEELDLNLLGSDELRHYREAVEARRDRTGSIVGVIGTKTDITEQHQARQQLTEMLSFRERVMGVLGHDLRNPLMAIGMANIRLLDQTDLSQQARHEVERSQRSAERMRELIESLLDFTHARFLGTIRVAPVPSDLAEVARSVVDDSREGSPDRAIELEILGDAHGTWDPGRIAQVISNLVGNAVAYGAPEAPVRVQIDATGDPVILSVHNEGRCIPQELLPVVFEPFRRGGGDKSPRGLGLGLYIVRQLVQAHGGTVDVRSTEQEGTTFTVELPRTSRSLTLATATSEAIH